MGISIEQLEAITGQNEFKLIPFLSPLNDTLTRFTIDTPAKQAYFLSQICHESGCFRYTEEIASGVDYEGRTDLGNTISGDGMRFKGRGLIQITGRANYKKLSDYFGTNFIANPYALKNPQWACLSAGWFWSKKGLNEVCDKNNFLMVTYLINGGFNGLEDRLKYLVKSYNVLKLDGLAEQMRQVTLEVSHNFSVAPDTRFRKLLFKQIPDQNNLNILLKKLQTL